ncbi:gas vesicle protein GvpO [Streptomyces xiamenensis]|uniref:Gas vesicle synthesis protein n=1 Tax=Streptomyces xiamenensis TaxID=408015 RepID=A0A0F7FZQ5_9ACTN|nr:MULTISPECIES: gas vesicle protein [Streptomyces]AKG46343.1 gas vesicle synthesis protein [Streptomyces xiamenensis]MCU4746139.1 gas vesicle protein [Streptomyces sp. G-5]QQN76463.1 gas vesicle protein [Streptomyces sp. XC 2026]
MPHHSEKQRSAPVKGPIGAARRAGRRLSALTGHAVDGVSAVSPLEDGWRVRVDVIEVPRIPDTTSLMATYEVDLDHNGRLVQYERVRRYRRCATDD